MPKSTAFIPGFCKMLVPCNMRIKSTAVAGLANVDASASYVKPPAPSAASSSPSSCLSLLAYHSWHVLHPSVLVSPHSSQRRLLLHISNERKKKYTLFCLLFLLTKKQSKRMMQKAVAESARGENVRIVKIGCHIHESNVANKEGKHITECIEGAHNRRRFPVVSEYFEHMIALSGERNSYILYMLHRRGLLPNVPKGLLKQIEQYFYNPFNADDFRCWFDIIAFENTLVYVEAAESGRSEYFERIYNGTGPQVTRTKKPRIE